jgi:hypothetical protein
MKSKLISILSLFVFCFATADCQKSHLLSSLSPRFLADNVQSVNDFHPFPTVSDREQWAVLVPDSLKAKYITDGEKLLHHRWQVLSVSDFLSFYRNGNRDGYQSLIFKRRTDLSQLVMAELLEGKGRFLNDIVNGVWAVCEETFWGIPAHLDYRNKTKGFPDPDNQIVDLFNAETGSLIAWTYYLLGNELDSISPFIRQRMYKEVNRRIFEPCMRNDYWWMGFKSNTTINWNPWINSNWLTCTLLMEYDSVRRNALLVRNLKSLDNFIDHYPPDGGCDEGPSYWNRAGGALYQALDLLFRASGGAINFYSDTRIAEIARYIYRLHIDGHYFVNFADASALVYPDISLLFDIGQQTKDQQMLGFAAYLAKLDNFGNKSEKSEFGSLYNVLASLEVQKLKDSKPVAPMLATSWLPSIQVCTARSHEGSDKGLFFAALGGHNAENHNHNDVGSFILYYNGKPLLIDAGVGDYTAQTFSSRRYEIWTMQSAFHNLPTINGQMQKDGALYKATDVQFISNKKEVEFSLDISKAYPEQAMIKSWKRKYSFVRETGLNIDELYELQSFKEPFLLSFMSFPEPVLVKAGEINFRVDGRDFKLVYPESLFEASVEKKEFADNRLRNAWGRGYLYRLILKSKRNSLKGTYRISVSPKEGKL